MTNEQGRPRDARIDAAALDAAAALLLEVGYADLTLAAVAARAGTSRPAVYRRWPTKAHLVHEAVFRGDDLDAPAPESLKQIAANVGGIFSMQPTHWTMHAGQWAVVRRKLGRPPLF